MFKNAKEVAEALAQAETAKAQVISLTAELDGLKAKHTTFDGQIATLNADLTGARTDLAAANAKIAELTAAHATNITELKASHAAALQTQKDGEQARIDTRVTELCAAAGVDPIKRDPKAGGLPGDVKTLARAEFNKLSAAAQSDFCTKGGTLTD